MAATSAAVVFGAVVFAPRSDRNCQPNQAAFCHVSSSSSSLRPSGSHSPASASKPSSSSASGRAFSTESNSARAAAATSVESLARSSASSGYASCGYAARGTLSPDAASSPRPG